MAPTRAQDAQRAEPDAKAPAKREGERSVETPSGPALLPATGRRFGTGSLPGLQRAAGNRAVGAAVRDIVQRVQVDASFGETLYNRETGGQATAGHFSGGNTYEMTRQGDTGVTVNVTILFQSQSRNTVPPTPPATSPRLGALIGSPTEIPAGDPRRAWATDMAAQAVTNWNGRVVFAGEENSGTGGGSGSGPAGGGGGGGGADAGVGPAAGVPTVPTRKRLPVTFRAEAVFTGTGSNAQVIVHPASSIGGSAGHPIDAGNWYEQKNPNVYPAADNVIYAHEYGHLLGIPDEYSQSNRQMHLLMHEASPTGAATAMAALDRVTVERMVLAALSRPLYGTLSSSLGGVIAAIRAQQRGVTRQLSSAASEGMRDPGVTAALEAGLEQASESRLHAGVPRIAAFQTTTNFSARSRAGEAVRAEFAGPALTSRIQDAYWSTLNAPHGQNVAVAGLGDVRVNMSSGVFAMGQGTGPAAAPAGALATSLVGPTPAAPAGSPPLAVTPSPSLIDQLTTLPDTWNTAGGAVESALTSGEFASRVQATLQQANLLAAVADAMPFMVTRPKISQVGALYRRARDVVRNAAMEAARQMVAELLGAQLDPVLQASVGALQTQIRTEVDRVMTSSPGTTAAASTPDPNMVAMVAAIKARFDASKAATASQTSRDPMAGGGSSPAQDVTYSYQGLMGSNNTTAVRSDQFNPMVGQFNTSLKLDTENDFTAEAV